jgi:DNA-binding NtrC family response regulator
VAKILLIDDDSDLRRFLQGALEHEGNHVACLDRAEGAADVLATGEFDLVLMDEHLPGIAGSELLKVLRKKGLQVPTILMTGYAKGDIVPTAKNLGAPVVGKPSGGHDELWKELAPLIADALKGEMEVRAALRRAVDAALKAGKTNLAPRLRRLLDHELLLAALNAAGGEQHEASRILGLPLARLVGEEATRLGSGPQARSLSFQAEALLFINNFPGATAAEIAEKLGCSKAKLYRDPIINRALKARAASSSRPPSGFKTPEGDVEAYED